jgi:transposase
MIARGRITARFANVSRCLIGIEAGMATHYVARELSALGHDVRQVPPAYAKPFRQGHKNDFRDDRGGCSAAVDTLRARGLRKTMPASSDKVRPWF